MSNEDFNIEDITPEDLGCMGEQEIDPGVVEETAGSGTPKQPISLCFEKIPFEKRKAYRKIYDGFEKKDMSFPDFCIEMFALTSPALMQQDLSEVMGVREGRGQAMVANRQAINRSMN